MAVARLCMNNTQRNFCTSFYTCGPQSAKLRLFTINVCVHNLHAQLCPTSSAYIVHVHIQSIHANKYFLQGSCFLKRSKLHIFFHAVMQMRDKNAVLIFLLLGFCTHQYNNMQFY